MHRRWPLTTWLALLLTLAGVAYFGSRWLVAQFYPLRYRTILFARSQEYGLDPYLVAAVIRTESRFRPDVTSLQGARGLMQIMPSTGAWIAEQLNLPYAPEMLYDPDYNVRLGCWYLAHLHREFGADTVLALAAYNGGSANVQKWLQERQWTGEDHTLDQIPFTETRLYVAKVLRDLQTYRRIYASEPTARREFSDAGKEPLRR